MHRFSVVFSLLLVAVLTIKSHGQESCSAKSVHQFVTDLEYASLEFGYFADLDKTSNSLCMKASTSCERFQLIDNGYDGYYEPHTIYYITYGTKVIFAKTSQYYEMTYGQLLGTANAKSLRDEKFKVISQETGCSSDQDTMEQLYRTDSKYSQ